MLVLGDEPATRLIFSTPCSSTCDWRSVVRPKPPHRCSRYEMISELERAETESIATNSVSVCSTLILSRLRPQALLQIAESFDHFFLNQMTAFRYDGLSTDYDFAHGCPR